MNTCAHCPGELRPHDGMQHCAGCGCYFRGGELDSTHTPCHEALRRAANADAATETVPVAEEPPTAERVTRKAKP